MVGNLTVISKETIFFHHDRLMSRWCANRISGSSIIVSGCVDKCFCKSWQVDLLSFSFVHLVQKCLDILVLLSSNAIRSSETCSPPAFRPFLLISGSEVKAACLCLDAVQLLSDLSRKATSQTHRFYNWKTSSVEYERSVRFKGAAHPPPHTSSQPWDLHQTSTPAAEGLLAESSGIVTCKLKGGEAVDLLFVVVCLKHLKLCLVRKCFSSLHILTTAEA